jgi:dihydropteroate synthase
MSKYINISGNLYDLSLPTIMAIVNITPDSFFGGSRYSTDNEAFTSKIKYQIDNGATIIDIGGYSTRPGAKAISIEEELKRVLPAIEIIKKEFPKIIISIDTFRSQVASESIKAGANIINDVAGGLFDEKMYEIIAELNVPYILMHNRGTIETMHQKSDYQSVNNEVMKELESKIKQLRTLGVKDIIIDPGFGFSKNVNQNFELLAHFEEFKQLNCPILAGLSRKSMIWRSLNIDANEALNGTTALNMFALSKGANILRVHDAKEANECIQLFNKINAYLKI